MTANANYVMFRDVSGDYQTTPSPVNLATAFGRLGLVPGYTYPGKARGGSSGKGRYDSWRKFFGLTP